MLSDIVVSFAVNKKGGKAMFNINISVRKSGPKDPDVLDDAKTAPDTKLSVTGGSKVTMAQPSKIENANQDSGEPKTKKKKKNRGKSKDNRSLSQSRTESSSGSAIGAEAKTRSVPHMNAMKLVILLHFIS